MRYNNKYAMPVDPRVLEKDFETDTTVNLNSLLRYISKLFPLKKANPLYLKLVNNAFWTLWKQIDHKLGINLRDREKLVPHFTLMGELVPPKDLKFAFRGARLSSYDPNLLSRTYPNIKKGEVIKSPKDPEVLAHLQSLAYGLRSWSDDKNVARNWALGNKGNVIDPTKDKVVFICKKPNVLFDVGRYWDALDKHQYEETERWDNQDKAPFDYNEKIIYLKNPKIKEIHFGQSTGIWYALVSES